MEIGHWKLEICYRNLKMEKWIVFSNLHFPISLTNIQSLTTNFIPHSLTLYFMNVKEMELGKHADICDVCELPLKHIEHPFTAEYQGKVLSFCSATCYEKYLEDPAQYAQFEDDEGLE